MKNKPSGFTLVEMLIVVALIGALATLMLPSFKVKKKNSFENIIKAEMYEIRLAFLRFENDCMPSNEELDKLTNFYFAPLFDERLTSGTNVAYSYSKYDPNKSIGWEGPYALSEGTITVTVESVTYSNVPAFLDPYNNPYRIIKDSDKYYIVTTTNDEQTSVLSNQLTFANE